MGQRGLSTCWGGGGGARLPPPRSPLAARRDALHRRRATRAALPAQMTSVSSQPWRGRWEGCSPLWTGHRPEVGTQSPATGQVSPCSHPSPEPSLLSAFPSPQLPTVVREPGPSASSSPLGPQHGAAPAQPASHVVPTHFLHLWGRGDVWPQDTGRGALPPQATGPCSVRAHPCRTSGLCRALSGVWGPTGGANPLLRACPPPSSGTQPGLSP